MVKTKRSFSGFSLVELSIVLVILGLLTGGVLTGQSLIRAAELRAVSTEFQTYNTAINTFRGKYFAIPGDMNNATSFWGDNVTHCTDTNIADGTPGTCNGDGDGNLEEGAASSNTEEHMFWNHLSQSGIIEGNYDGIAGGTSGRNGDIGRNTPASKISGAGWMAMNFDVTAANGELYRLNYGNLLMLGAEQGSTWTGNFWTGNAIFKPEEAWNLDTKIDDGQPHQGKIIAMFWNEACARRTSGAASNDNFDTEYNLANGDVACALVFRDMF